MKPARRSLEAMVKFQHLRFFCAVVDCGSATLAAERLHISQPALSAGLKALENALGQALFERSGGRQRLVPTAAALRFYDDAKAILERCAAAQAAFARPAAAPLLRLGVLRSLACDDVAAVLAPGLAAAEPGWSVREGTAAELGGWLAQGRISIAWTTLDRLSTDSEVLWRERYAVLVARHHRLAGRPGDDPDDAVTAADLAGEALLLRTGCELRSGRLRAAGIGLRAVARINRDDLLLRLVAANAGIAVAPQSFATAEVVARPLAVPGLIRSVGLRWRPETPAGAVARVRDAVLASGRPPCRLP